MKKDLIKQLRSQAAKQLSGNSVRSTDKNLSYLSNLSNLSTHKKAGLFRPVGLTMTKNTLSLALPHRGGKQVAFTLAEVMITLGIIGVVAAVTMPALITNVNERVYKSRHENIAQKVTQAMERMRALDKLNATYSTTDAFVDELQNYLKISKRCNANNITDCWPTSTVINSAGDEFEVSEAKIGKDIALETETNNVGLILADGASLILNYNPNSSELDIGSRITTEPNYKYTTTVTSSIDFLTDVNGSKGPNKEGKDIRPLRTASFSGHQLTCEEVGGTMIDDKICNLGTNYTCLDNTSYAVNTGYNDCYAGAIKICKDLNMYLPSIGNRQPSEDNEPTTITLSDLYDNRDNYTNIPTSGSWWSSTPHSSNTNNAWAFYFTGSGAGINHKGGGNYVLCVSN